MTILNELESAFGSDKAVGLYFEVEEQVMSFDEFMAWSADKQDQLDDLNWQSYLPGGESSVVCTNYARLVMERYPDRTALVGFYNDDNPTSRIAIEGMHADGHDFALVDDRYLVDPWIKLVAGESERAVFDMQCDDDAAQVRAIYGPRSCWSPL